MIYLNGVHLSIKDVIAVVRNDLQVALDPDQLELVKQSRRQVEKLVRRGDPIYGINTGFGKLADTSISPSNVEKLQRNLILSHSSGVGQSLSLEIVKAMMLLRANALMKGYSGIRAEVIQLLIDMVNRSVIPVVPAQGSVGASGDLVPLAHMSAVLIGEGQAFYNNQVMPGREALMEAGLEPVVLQSKEGLALINGTQNMTAHGVIGIYDAWILMKTADIAGALTMEALQALPNSIDERVHILRPHGGQMVSARNLRRILSGSKLVSSLSNHRVQDAYSLRCIPQVHGASRDVLQFVEKTIETEINSVTDNPIIFSHDGDVISAGNFHGQPVAFALDFLGITLGELGNISERRIERMVNPQLSGLPPFLVLDSGLNSGYMISQYTAAALVSENKILAHPASVDSIPTSANQEDHVSMGAIAARKMLRILTNVRNILSIEILCACQALEFCDRSKLASATSSVYGFIRKQVPPLTEDRCLEPEIRLVHDLIFSEEIVNIVEDCIGKID